MFDVFTRVNVHPHPQSVKDHGEALPTRSIRVAARSRARNCLREGLLAQTTGMTAQGKGSQPAKATRPPSGRAAAKELDAQILEVLGGGAAGSAVIAQRTGISRRTVQYHLLLPREHGLVGESPRGTFRLSGAGQARVLAARQPALVSTPEPGALARLPAEHQALIRLISDAVVARRALAALHTSNWPGFVLLGPSKTGKTLIAQLVCRRFGLDPTLHIRVLPRETSGSIWGRRFSEPGGSWRFEPAPLLAASFAALDEFDKATPEVQRAAHAYLQGDSEFAAEEGRAEVRATPLVLLNQDRGIELLPEPYLRRSVVLDTGQLLSATADIDEVARRVLGVRLPQVPEDLAPPEPTFPEPARQLLRTALQGCLSGRGWRRADIESLSRIALGRWATDPAAGAERAAFGVAADYLLCTATRTGEVVDDWSTRLEAVATAAPTGGAREALAAARRSSATERERHEEERRRVQEEHAALEGKREELLARIAHALRSVPRGLAGDEVARAAGAQGRAKTWRDEIRDARALEELVRLEAIVEREVLSPLAEIGRARVAATETAAAAKREAAERRKAEQERKKWIDAYVAALQARYLRTEAAFDPSVLRELLELRCVEAQSYQYQEETVRSTVRRVARRVGQEVSRLVGPAKSAPAAPDPLSQFFPQFALQQFPQLAPQAAVPPDDREYETKTWTWYVDRDGKRHSGNDLRSWGSPDVKTVLRAAARRYGRVLKEPRRRAASANGRSRLANGRPSPGMTDLRLRR